MHYIFFLIFKSLFPGNHFNGKKFGCSHPLAKANLFHRIATPIASDGYTLSAFFKLLPLYPI